MGPLALLGSGEFLPWSSEVDHLMLELSTSGDGSVAIVPTASAPEGEEVFNQWASMGLAHYKELDVDSFVVPIRSRDDAMLADNAAMIERASYIFFSGGNPAYLADTMRDTPFWKTVLIRRDAGVSLGGCSAGAVFLGETAPDPTSMDDPQRRIQHPGLALIPKHVIGPHWDMLDTYVAGLRGMIKSMMPDDWTLIGIDEDTALVIDSGDWRVFGRGGVHVSRAGQSIEL